MRERGENMRRHEVRGKENESKGKVVKGEVRETAEMR